MTLLDGKQIAAEIRAELRTQIEAIVATGRRAPKLGIVIVGHNPASETYVANKLKACAEVGICQIHGACRHSCFYEIATHTTLLGTIYRIL